MAKPSVNSARQILLRFIKEEIKRTGYILPFSEARQLLEQLYPHFFCDSIRTKRTERNYYSAMRVVEKEIVEQNATIKRHKDLRIPENKLLIAEELAKNYTTFVKAKNKKTIVLTLKNKETVFVKTDKKTGEAMLNLVNFSKYWHAQNEGEYRRMNALKSRLNSEILEELDRITANVVNSNRCDKTKLEILKKIKDSM